MENGHAIPDKAIFGEVPGYPLRRNTWESPKAVPDDVLFRKISQANPDDVIVGEMSQAIHNDVIFGKIYPAIHVDVVLGKISQSIPDVIYWTMIEAMGLRKFQALHSDIGDRRREV